MYRSVLWDSLKPKEDFAGLSGNHQAIAGPHGNPPSPVDGPALVSRQCGCGSRPSMVSGRVMSSAWPQSRQRKKLIEALPQIKSNDPTLFCTDSKQKINSSLKK